MNCGKIFVGVDQTGAIDRRGRPKPLAAAAVANNELSLFTLASFSGSALRRALARTSLDDVVVVVDCVLGLPRGARPEFAEALVQAAEAGAYGRWPARIFFERFTRPEGAGLREVDALCRASSVFAIHPFQRNVQTGTFRIWRDLGREPGWFCVPYFGERRRAGQATVLEGYPSLAWRRLFNLKVRRPDRLVESIERVFPGVGIEDGERLGADGDFADAAVLALAGWRWADAFTYPPRAREEGWILGAD